MILSMAAIERIDGIGSHKKREVFTCETRAPRASAILGAVSDASEINNRLDRAIDVARDHLLGPTDAPIVLVEYGSYACPHCRAANERIAQVRDMLGERLMYVFRHRPLTDSELARRAAELVERTHTADEFWKAHIALMTRSETLGEDDLRAVAEELGLESESEPQALAELAQARERVESDERSARRSGVAFTPTFFINGRRYDGAWDESSFTDAMLGSLGHRVRAAALDFASWAPSAGLLLLLASLAAVGLTSSGWGREFAGFWERRAGFAFGDWGYLLPLLNWVNDGLLTVFFLVVGLEIKREFTVGHLASHRSAALPVAAALGGMAIPAILYASIVPSGPWAHGWGVPMPTDTAFAVALIVMMGRRVPLELRIFLTAASIVDDLGTIAVVALFYSGTIEVMSLALAALLVGVLAWLNHSRVYYVVPYFVVGVLLWLAIHASGLHATLTGVILALFIPTRPPANLGALVTQANSIIDTEAGHRGEVLRHGPSLAALRALDAIHDRLESPADRMLRKVAPLSSYMILPLFALANAGVMLAGGVMREHVPLVLAIVCGLVIGKPAGILIASYLAVRSKLAVKPDEYSWRQLFGAAVLAGIGFTMSLFIAAQGLSGPEDFAAAKIAVFLASIVSAAAGLAILWNARAPAAGGSMGERPDRVCIAEPGVTEPAPDTPQSGGSAAA
jgi:Na+:H+ antiporter, NhaA family